MGKFGGRQENAGRKKGVPNKGTAEWRSLFDQFDGADRAKTRRLIAKLFELATLKGFDRIGKPRADVRAAEALLDRRYGKPTPEIDADHGRTLLILTTSRLTVEEFEKKYGGKGGKGEGGA